MREHGFSWKYDKGLDIPLTKSAVSDVSIGSIGPINLATCERTTGKRRWMVNISFVDNLSNYVHVQSETDDQEDAEHAPPERRGEAPRP